MEEELLNLLADLYDVLAKHHAYIDAVDEDELCINVAKSREFGEHFCFAGIRIDVESLKMLIDENKPEDEYDGEEHQDT